MSTPEPQMPAQKRSTGVTLNLVTNGLIAVAWLAVAVMFAVQSSVVQREGAVPFNWLLKTILIILVVMLAADIRSAIKSRSNSIEAMTGIFMWLGFLCGLIYYVTDFPASHWLGAAAALLLGLSFGVRVWMTLRKAKAAPPQA